MGPSPDREFGPVGQNAPDMDSISHRPRTLVEKIWDDHVVAEGKGAPSVLAIDLHLVHEVTSPQAFTGLRRRGLTVPHPERTVATADHSIPTTPRNLPILDDMARAQVEQLTTNCREFGIPLHGLGDPNQGIVHVIGPQLGLTQPGMTIVCGDSHTSTHGAFGALAFGIGTSEVEMVLATQCLLQRRPKTYEVRVDGRLAPGVSAKDVILNLLSRIGVAGGTGHVFEYRGSAIEALSMEQRMTICNMSIEGGARAGLIAPDDTTFEYIEGRPHAPTGAGWDAAIARWRELPTDDGATFDRSITIDASALEPMITYGTNPGMGLSISANVPDPATADDGASRRALEQALGYMDLQPGQPILGQKVDVVFIGSCTNGRISDLRLAAAALRGRKVADGVRMMVVPGSDEVKREAEREGLDEIFRAAGADWREAGCSMCIAMNGDQLSPGQYAVSTSNRNFEGRQGKGGRTFLASPLTAAASAVAGVIADPRLLPGIETLAAVGGR
jgi:3-isopropylmalate/(R)-2-methylmalate dehydratase large subunit